MGTNILNGGTGVDNVHSRFGRRDLAKFRMKPVLRCRAKFRNVTLSFSLLCMRHKVGLAGASGEHDTSVGARDVSVPVRLG